jgi:hypothetical protein
MTYQNDPNRDFDRIRTDRRMAQEGWGMGSIILASLAALAVVFGLFYAMSNRGDSSLARNDRPAVTTPATTTGSGAASRTPDSTGSKPAMPDQVPAPASPPATNR